MSFFAPVDISGAFVRSRVSIFGKAQFVVCSFLLFLRPFPPSLGVFSFTTVTQAAPQHEHCFWKNTTAPEPSRNVKLLRHKLFCLIAELDLILIARGGFSFPEIRNNGRTEAAAACFETTGSFVHH